MEWKNDHSSILMFHLYVAAFSMNFDKAQARQCGSAESKGNFIPLAQLTLDFGTVR